MNFGSLFSGIGGFDLGFERAGMTCRWQAELDRQASTVLTRHWPGVKKYRHVESINYRTGKAYRRYFKPEAVDVICGGFPCQDVSVAGKRAGLAGGRSGLWFEFHRILSQSHPEWVVIENVPGLLSSNGGRDFAVILRGLVELGYGVAWRIFDAQYFGVAQRRRRVFIVGHIGDGRAAEILFEREGGAGDIAPSRKEGARIAAPVNASTPSRRNGGSSPTPDTFIAWDNGQGDPNADADGTAFSLNPQGNQGVMVAGAQGSSHGGVDDNDAQANHLVAGTLNAHMERGLQGQDAHTDLLVARSLTSRQSRLDGDADNFHVVATLQASGAGTSRAAGMASEPDFLITHTLRAEGHDASEDGTGRGVPLTFQPRYYSGRKRMGGKPSELVGTLSADAAEGDSAPMVFESRFARNGRGAPDSIVPPLKAQSGETGKGDAAPLVTGFMPRRTNASASEELSPTQNSGGGGFASPGIAGAFGVRRLMPVECERLQGFPDDWTAGQPDSPRYKQLGNAVEVDCAEWIGRRIMVTSVTA